ncbi:MAG: AAA family ATPase [Desulfovibrionaceae bacterium]
MFERELEDVLSQAVLLATEYRHEFLTVEHILYSILESSEGQTIFEELDVDFTKAFALLDYFFKDNMKESVTRNKADQIIQTTSVQRVLGRAIQYVQNSDRNKAAIGDVFLAIFDEEDTYARSFLQALEVTRLDILHAISFTKDSEESGADNDSSLLSKLTIALSEQAEMGNIDPIVGRKKEIQRILQILSRRKKNNPILIGDPGVGKSAIIEGLALQIARGDVPEQCKDMKLFILEMGNLLAGTKYRGDFESKMQELLKEIQKIPNAVLVIDEIHTIVGAGATSGSSVDAASLLKPILAKGSIRCIGSTTYEEFQRYVEKDRALARRFQKVFVEEPSEKEAIDMMHILVPLYEKHHNVHYTKKSIKAAVELSSKYITERHLPDKAIDVIDEAGALARLSSLNKEKISIVTKDIEDVVASISQVPVKTIEHSDTKLLQNLEVTLKKNIVGQDNAIEQISKAVLRSYIGFEEKMRPVASFLFYGSTGVGKTELAKALASSLGIDFHRFDMSEYMEQHAVSRLIGSPPGYVGFEQSGLLTETIRKTPHSVILLDEIEKAHHDIYNVLLQIMDYATITDNKGRKADCKNIILIMTSNVGVEEMSKNTIGFDSSHTPDTSKSLRALEKTFTPEFRNRLDAMIAFNSLTKEDMQVILVKSLDGIYTAMKVHKITLTITDKAQKYMIDKGFNAAFGARPLQRFIRTTVQDMLAEAILYEKIKKGDVVIIDRAKNDGEDVSKALIYTVVKEKALQEV